MSSIEQEVKDAWSPASGGGDFSTVEYLKIEAGKSATVRILQNKPTVVENHCRIEVNKNGRLVGLPVVVSEEDAHLVREKNISLKTLHSLIVLDRRDGKVKIWEPSSEKIRDIGNIVNQWNKYPTEFDVVISRTGSGKTTTRYSITISPNQAPLTEEEMSLEKPDLSDYYKPNRERLLTLLSGKTPGKKEASTEEGSGETFKADAPVAPSPNKNPLETSEVI